MWNSSHFLLLNDDPELKYDSNSTKVKNNIHDDQRKVCLSLLQFLTEFVHIDNPVIIYIGNISMNSVIFNAELFPDIRWHLYSSIQFKDQIKLKSKNVNIYNTFFTDEDAEVWRENQEKDQNIYLFFDIRTTIGDLNAVRDGDEKDKQMEWCKTIKPVSASLNFKLPYIIKDDIMVEYLDGFIFKQPWSPKAGTETRLVPFDNQQMKTYSSLKYESQMFHHNSVIRYHIYSFYDNEYTFDKMCEFGIIYNYIYKKLNKTRPSNEVVSRYSEYITTILKNS